MSWKIEKSNYKILVRLFLTKRHSFVTKIKRKKWKILVFIMYFSIIFEYSIYPNEKIRKILKKVLTIKINCDILIEYLWVKKQQQILINALVAKSVDAQDLKSCGNLSRAGSSPARGTTIILCGSSSVGRASAFQAECREFDPRLPLQNMSH